MPDATLPAPSEPDSGQCLGIRQALSRVGDKWSVMVVVLLGEGARRFSELKRAVPDISQRMLTLTLRNLERDGLVSRTVTPVVPPRVDYALTDLGRSLRAPVGELGRWAVDNLDAIQAARASFDGVAPARPAARTVSPGQGSRTR